MHETYDEMITDGIDICEWDVPIKNEKQPLQYSVWDFAGQTVYYNTHQVSLKMCVCSFMVMFVAFPCVRGL